MSKFLSVLNSIWFWILIVCATDNKNDENKVSSSSFRNTSSDGRSENHHGRTIPCPRGTNGYICSGLGKCNFSTGSCVCFPDTIGIACQYDRQLMTCTNQRYCVQCRVLGTGPFAEDNNGCEEFCRLNPTPVIVYQFDIFNEGEILCSFIDLSNATNICRFYFKLVNLLEDKRSSGKNTYPNDVLVIAQKDPECDGKQRYFPHPVMAENPERDDQQGQIINGPGYATMFVLFALISLPFIACIASCIHNFKRLPCGFCTILRRPTSAYLRNVRPYPGLIVEILDDNNPAVNV